MECFYGRNAQRFCRTGAGYANARTIRQWKSKRIWVGRLTLAQGNVAMATNWLSGINFLFVAQAKYFRYLLRSTKIVSRMYYWLAHNQLGRSILLTYCSFGLRWFSCGFIVSYWCCSASDNEKLVARTGVAPTCSIIRLSNS